MNHSTETIGVRFKKKKESKRNQEEVYTIETDMETTWGQYLEWF